MYDKALNGDAKWAKRFLLGRYNYEYERVHEERVE